MSIQWSLVLFTALCGTASWLLVFFGVSELRGIAHAAKTKMTVAVTSLVLLLAGGIASVTHLSHPDRMMGALGHPTMGIFVEAVLVGILIVLVLAYLLMAKREASAGSLKTMGIVIAVVALVFSFALGYSYMMSARPAWNTIALPLAYLGTAAASGAGLYALVLAVCNQMEEHAAVAGADLLIGGVLSLVTSLAYGGIAGLMSGSEAVLFWVGVVVCGGIVPAVCGNFLKSKPGQAKSYCAIAFVLGLVGCVALRCIMWLAGEGINYFGIII